MLKLVIRRMLNSGWLTLCQALGVVLAVAMISSVPIYTNGILKRMLTKDLEQFQISGGSFPGSYLLKATFDAGSGGEDEELTIPWTRTWPLRTCRGSPSRHLGGGAPFICVLGRARPGHA